MAAERENDRAEGRSSRRWTQSPVNKTQWRVLVGLALLLIVGGVVCSGGSGKKKGGGDTGARAVVIPGDRARTVVVPACGTGEKITSRNASEQIRTPGSTAFGLPPGPETRAVVVPRCSASGGSESPSGAPSAAYVLPTGDPKASGQAPGAAPPSARSKLIVPRGSRARTVVVTPCTKPAPRERTVVLAPRQADSRTAVAPAC